MKLCECSKLEEANSVKIFFFLYSDAATFIFSFHSSSFLLVAVTKCHLRARKRPDIFSLFYSIRIISRLKFTNFRGRILSGIRENFRTPSEWSSQLSSRPLRYSTVGSSDVSRLNVTSGTATFHLRLKRDN